MYTQKSFVLKPADADKKWHLIDAKDKVVGRVATEIARLLRGKHNPQFTPNTDSGDFVVVINAEKIRFTGNKMDDKKYHWHTGYVGGIKTRSVRDQLEKHPELIIQKAVKGMLPKNSLGRKQLSKLKIYVGEEHKNQAQDPQAYNI